MKKFFKPVLAAGLTALLFSCNNNSDKKADEGANAPKDTMTTADNNAPAMPTVPFDVMIIYHTVKDYKAWRPVYDGDTARRMASGLTEAAVERSADKPDDLKIVFRISDIEKAKAMGNDPALKEAMDKAGVISKPDIKFWRIVRFNPEKQVPGGMRVEIVHKVKDFDAWLKVYDGEGAATRASHGMEDMVIARGIDDPNMLHIVFAVTDKEKAKARLADPALKKLMEDAGVEGKPVITFYTDASE